MKALTLGWAPTLVGYSMQGIGKFGFYEAFKNLYGGLLGEVYFNYVSRYMSGCLMYIHRTSPMYINELMEQE